MNSNRVTAILLCALVAALYLSGCQKIETPNHSATPNSSTGSRVERVEKALAAADITLPEVATFLYSRGWTVVQTKMPKPHWARPVVDATHPAPAYYVCDIRVATGDTSLAMYFPQTAGPYCVQVKAVSAAGVSGPWSLVGWSDGGEGGNSLPGVRP